MSNARLLKESLVRLTDPNYPGMAITRKGQLVIRVSPPNVRRALPFMDTFVKCIRARGFSLRLDVEGTYIVIRSIELKVNFRERTTRCRVSDKPFQEFEWRPNGKVVFRIDSRLRSEWGI